MMRSLYLIVAAAVLVSPVDADQASLSAKKLLEWCTSDVREIKTGCTLYIFGFSQGISFASGKEESRYFCPPAHVTSEEARVIFVRAMRTLKKFEDESANTAIAAALGTAFPCRKNSN